MLEIHQCVVKHCSHVVITSSDPQLGIKIPYIQLAQGRREFGSGAISAEDLLKIADIPALDFSAEYPDFCEQTVEYINNFTINGIKPTQWQRPTDRNRISKARKWLNEPKDNSMPDGILIGQRDNHINYLENIDLHSKIGGFDIYQLTVTNQLLDNCPNCGPFQDENGNPVFRNRCKNHNCEYHKTSTSPFNIIDGQHRSMSLHNSSLGSKQMAVSILLQHSKYQTFKGYSNDDQALIFNQVNTKSSALDNLHKTWLKRFFGTWSDAQNDDSNAFDLLAKLGTASQGSVTNPWSPYVKIHPNEGEFRIDSNRATDAGSGAVDGMSSLSSIFQSIQEASQSATAATGIVRTSYDIMVDWLKAAIEAFPNRFSLPAAEEFFDSQRPFEALIRIFDRIKTHAQSNPNFSGQYNYEDFLWSFSQHSVSLNVNVWNLYKGSGERPMRELINVLSQMWPNNAPTNLPVQPTWYTMYDGGTLNCPSWNAYIGLTPDPIENYSDQTQSDPNTFVIPGGNLSPNNNRTIKSPGDTISWSRPRNVAKHPEMHYRVYGVNRNPGQWLNLPGKLISGPVTSSDRMTILELNEIPILSQTLTIRQDVLWDLKISYRNLVGETTVIICYQS
jgi:hypothetical protein